MGNSSGKFVFPDISIAGSKDGYYISTQDNMLHVGPFKKLLDAEDAIAEIVIGMVAKIFRSNMIDKKTASKHFIETIENLMDSFDADTHYEITKDVFIEYYFKNCDIKIYTKNMNPLVPN